MFKSFYSLRKFKEFKDSGFGLEIWSGKELLFTSKKGQIKGLVDFIKANGHHFSDLVIFDTIAGNAVALLAAHLAVKEVYAVLGSQRAKDTFEKFNIDYYFQKNIPEILNKAGNDICPLEKLSLFKTPEQFYDILKIR